MSKKKQYSSAGSLRTALEERLNNTAKNKGLDTMSLRRKTAFDRFLVRIFSGPLSEEIMLKGGYALEIGFNKSRTTKDIDICIKGESDKELFNRDYLRVKIQESAEIDMHDFFEYNIEESILDLENTPYTGFRFPVECNMAGRRFARFSMDIAIKDVWLDIKNEMNVGDQLLFAGIQDKKIRTIAYEQQFAEKLHSYSLPRKSQNSRVAA